jgi:hypothetical protein
MEIMEQSRLVVVSALICSLALQPQSPPSELGFKITPIIENVVDAAIPSSADFSAGVWRNRRTTERISRREFEQSISEFRTDLRRDALLRLQPLSRFKAQLDVIEELGTDADGAQEQALVLQGRVAGFQLSAADWMDIETQWDTTKEFLRRIDNMRDERVAAIADSSMRTKIARLDHALIPLIKLIDRESTGHDRERLLPTVLKLTDLLSEFHIICFEQLLRISADLRELLAWSAGMGLPETSSIPGLRDLDRAFEIHMKADSVEQN